MEFHIGEIKKCSGRTLYLFFKTSYLCPSLTRISTLPLKKLIRITTVPISLDKLLGKQLSFISQFYQLTAVSADKSELKRVASKYGVDHYHVEMTRAITPFRDLAAVWKLYRFLKKERPEMVHSHTPKAGLVGMMAAYFAGVPVRMHTVAGLPLLEARGIKRQVLNLVEKITYAFATNVYPNSFAMRDIIIKEGFCAPGKLKVLGNGSSNGIDTEYFSNAAVPQVAISTLREELGIFETDFVFVFVGRLVGDKGINELVAAFKNLASAPLSDRNLNTLSNLDSSAPGDSDPSGLRDRNSALLSDRNLNPLSDLDSSTPGESDPSGLSDRNSTSLSDGLAAAVGKVKLLLVGPLEAQLDALEADTLREIERHPAIISVGYQDDVRPYLAIADALAFPSYREGFPNVVLQAGAMELPAIVTDINGCNEIISEGENGLIIPVKDAEALKIAMEKMRADQVLYRRMKENARPLIESRYRQEVVWQALLEEYQSVSGTALH